MKSKSSAGPEWSWGLSLRALRSLWHTQAWMGWRRRPHPAVGCTLLRRRDAMMGRQSLDVPRRASRRHRKRRPKHRAPAKPSQVRHRCLQVRHRRSQCHSASRPHGTRLYPWPQKDAAGKKREPVGPYRDLTQSDLVRLPRKARRTFTAWRSLFLS